MVLLSVVLLASLYFFAPRFKKSAASEANKSVEKPSITSASILDGAKLSLPSEQKISLLSIENQLVSVKSVADSIRIYHNLAKFWEDSAHRIEPYLYYTYSAALLENSEKSLTFAAQLMVSNLIAPDAPPAIQTWMAGNAKVLLEKALVINPNNDSAKVNLGACYLFGNISDNPMQGILKVKEVVDKNPHNTYGQLILALGGKKSGQYDKAIERFVLLLKDEPKNIEAMVNLAECYELTNQNELAIEWYTKVKQLVNIPEAKDALDKRIKLLKK